MSEKALILRPGREKSLARRHPWVFSGSVAQTRGAPASGDTVAIRSADGTFLARAAYSPHPQISARVGTWNEAEPVDAAFFASRLCASIERRQALAVSNTGERASACDGDISLGPATKTR